MWESETQVSSEERVHRVSLRRDGENAAYAEVIEGWQCDAAFRAFFIGLLADAPFAAYFWETPAVTRQTIGRPFEFVLVDSPPLASMHPDGSDFEEYFEGTTESVVGFPNLGEDAWLVAPCPLASASAYTHLAAFVRDAPEAQQQDLWQAVGAAVEDRLAEPPLWLSTSGSGVPWLHVRLDSRPKYYTWRAYRQSG
ncbi:hypothetical protein BH24PSE2_BH24PSE2_01750 [soil metagenome]